MKRLLFLAFLLYSIQYAYAQTITGRMEIFHSKEVTDSLLQDYVGIWKYEDTLNRLVFQVELITMDNSRTIALRGRYSLNKDGEYITNEFNDPYIIRSKESSISGLLFKRHDFIVLSFTDRGNKNREAGTTEWGKECSFLKTYQENGKWYMQWHIIPDEPETYYIETEDDIPGDFWTVPEDCILEKVE